MDLRAAAVILANLFAIAVETNCDVAEPTASLGILVAVLIALTIDLPIIMAVTHQQRDDTSGASSPLPTQDALPTAP